MVMKWTGHVRMGVMRNAYRIFVGNHEVQNHLGDTSVDRRIILKWILKIFGVSV
jgi:hypothetical protein